MFPYKEDMFLQELMNITYALRELAEAKDVDTAIAVASVLSVGISIIALIITTKSLRLASNIAKDQNKISLYKDRYDVFLKISNYVFSITSLADSLLENHNYKSYSKIFEQLRYSFKCGQSYSEYNNVVRFIQEIQAEITKSVFHDGAKATFLFSPEINIEYNTLKDIFIEFLSKLENEEDLESSLKLLQQQGHYFMEHVFPKMQTYFILNESK